MRLRVTLLVAGLVSVGSLGIATPAHAEEVCVGTQNTVVVCVDPTGRTLYEDCIHTGGPDCTSVIVPGPTVSCSGRIGEQLDCTTTITTG